jgi:branched-chain amino acid transport system substrate-binding protein
MCHPAASKPDDLRLLGDIRGAGERSAALAVDIRGDGFELVGGARRENRLNSGFGKFARDRSADAGTCAGDNGNALGHILRHVRLAAWAILEWDSKYGMTHSAAGRDNVVRRNMGGAQMKRTLAHAAMPMTLAFMIGLGGGSASAGQYDTGASDTTIKIGQTYPLSGPDSGAAFGARAMAAYFAMLNDKGGINGRKIDLHTLDDGYSPPKTVEQTRRLVESDGVLLIFASLGTPTSEAVRPYLNSKKIPQLFLVTGASSVVDPKRYPWTMAGIPSYAAEGRIFAKYVLAEKPDAKIGILYDDDFGRDHLDAFVGELGDRASKMVVGKASYQITDPTLTSQIITLKSSGADTVYLITQGRASPQSVSAVRALGWNPLILLPGVSTSKGIIGSVGDEALKGVVSGGYMKDPTDPAYADDPAVKDYLAWVEKYIPAADQRIDRSAPNGFVAGQLMAEVLRRCGDDLTRANVLHQATSLKNFTTPMLLPGITINTSSTNYLPFGELQMVRYDGTRWAPFGKPIAD